MDKNYHLCSLILMSYFLVLIRFSIGMRAYGQTKTVISRSRPNIILILTDDQGIGDIRYEGNPYIKTPHLDQLASKSVRFTNFYVSPVCAPTRASIMTGKYSEETGIFDTYNGGAIMASGERTIAEILSQHGYRTGIIGKWHLGDNYPFRPMDQGFSYSLTFKSGGMGQPGDVKNFFAGNSAYFNPVLWRNGMPVQTKGYCSDVFTDKAIKFITSKKKAPFFLYLAYNVPHRPLQVPKRYYNMYRKLSFSNYKFSDQGKSMRSLMSERNMDDARKVYGMVTNLDDNIGRLVKALKQKKLAKNTIIIFLSDNGPAENRFKLGLRGRKTFVYQGGIKVPAFMYGPGLLPQNKEIHQVAAHIDLLPTILDFSGLHKQQPRDIDGKSLVPLVQGDKEVPEFNNRFLFWEWGRGYPVPFQNFAVRKDSYKLVGNTGYNSQLTDFELYNLNKDPDESENIIASHLPVAKSLRKKMGMWYHRIVHSKTNREVRRMQIGTIHENPVILDRNDALGQSGIWTQDDIYGYWNIRVKTSGKYTVKFKFIRPLKNKGTMHLKLYPYNYTLSNSKVGISTLTMKNVPLSTGAFRLVAYYQSPEHKNLMPLYVELKKIKV